ncbi:hypothetical protein AYK26_06975 [Euryarchaeota archaeon SM23-78]|nr:MAG: hypothetical protein AYK26_06975 [Euryarchaeota archaeon SM23-78]
MEYFLEDWLKYIELEAYVDDISGKEVNLEFGATQANMSFSETGSIQRKLRLKPRDVVQILIMKTNKNRGKR